jgi:hypothetical protein
MATRNGSAEWRGDLRGGDGDLTVGDGVFKGAYSFSSRFEEGQGTNPEELIAAAHAACFTMALSNILCRARALSRLGSDGRQGAPPSEGGGADDPAHRSGDRGAGRRDRRGPLRGACRGGKERLRGLARPRGSRGDDCDGEARGLRPEALIHPPAPESQPPLALAAPWSCPPAS